MYHENEYLKNELMKLMKLEEKLKNRIKKIKKKIQIPVRIDYFCFKRFEKEWKTRENMANGILLLIYSALKRH